MTLDVEVVVSSARAGTRHQNEAEVREEAVTLQESIPGYPWRWSTGNVQSEPGEVPNMIASEPADIDRGLVERCLLGRRNQGLLP